jgi:hypothetical protein
MVLQLQGEEVGRVLSNAAGRFIMRAPSSGRFTVRADRIGFASTTSDPLLLAVGDTVDIQMVAQVQAIELEGLAVEGERRCEVRPEAGRAVATVWEEARKALAAAEFTDQTGLFRYRIVRFTREMDEQGRRVLTEQRRAAQGYQRTPFESRPADVLAEEGYMKPDPDGDLYYAPDASVLLSDPFLDTHCLGLTMGRGEAQGLVGVSFEPIPGRDLPEIRGTVWIDPGTSELRRLDYQYENLDPGIRSDAVGGRVVFQGLPDGTWIVREWRIRMPSVAVAPDFTGGRQLVLVGIREVGGTVERVQDQLGQVVLEAQRATLAGAVFDGRLSGPVEVEVAVGDVTHVRLVAPPLSQILAEVCGEEERPEDSAVLAGTVRDSETGRPVPGATIRVLWTEYRFRGTSVARPGGGGNWQSILGIQEDGLQGQTDMDGRYLACTVPQDHPLQAEAESGDLTSGVVALRIPETDRLLIQDLEIVGTGTGGVAGRVIAWESGDPLPGAQVHLEGTGLQALTDPVGRFALEGAPLGRHVLEVNFLGRGGAADTVQIRPDRGLQVEVRLPLEAVELEGFTVEVLSAQERELRAEGFTGATIDRVSPEAPGSGYRNTPPRGSRWVSVLDGPAAGPPSAGS